MSYKLWRRTVWYIPEESDLTVTVARTLNLICNLCSIKLEDQLILSVVYSPTIHLLHKWFLSARGCSYIALRRGREGDCPSLTRQLLQSHLRLSPKVTSGGLPPCPLYALGTAATIDTRNVFISFFALERPLVFKFDNVHSSCKWLIRTNSISN